MKLENKIAIVTGAGLGMGRGIAERFAKEGAQVVIADVNEAASNETLELIGGRGLVVGTDLSKAGEIDALIDKTVATFGRIDILVNNAGTIHRDAAEDYSPEDWMRVVQVNLTSAFRLCQLAGREMLARHQGKIVNIASLLSFQGGIRVPADAASTGGASQMTQALANEWAGRNVQVNAIAPGYFRS